MSNEIKDGGTAFPHQDSGDTGTRPGMTLRDYFAAKAIGDLIIQGWDDQEIAIRAYRTADAMLAAREAKP